MSRVSIYLQPLREGWRLLFSTTLIGLLLALGLSLFLPWQYSSSVRLLITQTTATGLDPYTALKSTERLAQSMSELVHASTFSQTVLTQLRDFEANEFSGTEYTRRKAWRRSVETQVISGTGIMTVTTYHRSREQARILVEGVAREVVLQMPQIFGPHVRAQVIDSALDSRWFSRPNILANGFFGVLVGALVGLSWILLMLGKRRL